MAQAAWSVLVPDDAGSGTRCFFVNTAFEFTVAGKPMSFDAAVGQGGRGAGQVRGANDLFQWSQALWALLERCIVQFLEHFNAVAAMLTAASGCGLVDVDWHCLLRVFAPPFLAFGAAWTQESTGKRRKSMPLPFIKR